MARRSTSWFERSSALPEAFYARPTVEVARELLGKLLQVRSRGALCVGRIVETEAYGRGDPASHSARGPTPRSQIMFGSPGRAYVYFIYGMYEMLNFVTEPKGEPGAVLIRAVEPIAGIETMARRRGADFGPEQLCSGPGKLTRAFGVRRSLNGVILDGRRIGVFDDPCAPGSILVGPRVGIRDGRELPWRFVRAGSPFVSRAREDADLRALV